MSERKPGDPITIGPHRIRPSGSAILLGSYLIPLTDAPALAAAITTLAAEAGVPDDTAALVERPKPRILLLPDGRAGVCVGGRWDGWMMYRHPDGQWVSDHKMPEADPAARAWQAKNGGAK